MSQLNLSITHIIAVASGKGGVGKSTTSVNLALAFKQAGFRVGILDADLYGPNLPQLLGMPNAKPTIENKQLSPVVAYGLSSMSMGYLVEEKSPAIWRGPMASAALQQLLRDTDWGELDYLVIDLPPGTGDIPLTLAQKLPSQGVVMVTTPQRIALVDVRKAIALFQKTQVPLLGIVENMSHYQCEHCGHESSLFGTGGGALLAEEYQLPYLGAIPLDPQIRAHSDLGQPLVATQPNSPTSQAYQQIAAAIQKQLTQKTKSKKRFPRIVVE